MKHHIDPFFKEGESLDDMALPNWMNTNEMRQAMTTLSLFSEKERAYFEYQARQEYLREQRTIQAEREEAIEAKQAAIREKEAAMQEKEVVMQEKEAIMQEKEAAMQEKEVVMQREQHALLEIERLKALLASRS